MAGREDEDSEVHDPPVLGVEEEGQSVQQDGDASHHGHRLVIEVEKAPAQKGRGNLLRVFKQMIKLKS